TAEIPKDIRADKNIPPKIDTEISQIVKSQNRVENIIEQRVQTKQFKVEEKTQKSRATETLQSLLRGEKPSINPQIFTPTPSSPLSTATSETTKGLESLLHSEKSDNSTLSKLDGLSTNKVDSFEVKVNEAKQMIRYLSSDVKTAIEDYKSPFTRIKLQLNPQKLGDVEVTMVQRGSNLHVNISSNTAAINTLAMNMNELRVQLNNSGINNATINFNNTTQNSDTSSGQQQQNNQQEQQKARREYNYFDNREDTNEEILNSLEIVVPNYA
ncbi:MAG: flagellar hook-length control protein FliK, partial [Campylobacterota bacterium]|nr:flagellar hook-length control protein FliK [Campylobacterota bacterium]